MIVLGVVEIFKTTTAIITLIATLIAALGTLAGIIAKYSKSAKVRKAAEKAAKVAQDLVEITNAVNQAVETAEQKVNFTGADKKEWAMTQVQQFALDNGIFFDRQEVDELIEKAVAFTKSVNKREKDL